MQRTFTTIPELQDVIAQDHRQGLTIGFVPTMGALHAGHLSLVKQSRAENSKTVCSIFVNPSQFNSSLDLENYPRTPAADIQMLADAGCDYVFLPSVNEIYPGGPGLLNLPLGSVAETMEGRYRPGHFNGVATVVNRLFNIVKADAAYFGEKDYQQLAVIKKMAALMHHSVKIKGCETLREPDGLAMSSRNVLLNDRQRAAAPLIYQALKNAAEFIPYQSVEAVKELVKRYIHQSPLLIVEYFEIADTETLLPVTQWEGRIEVQGCIAVLTDGPRLIDNTRYTYHT